MEVRRRYTVIVQPYNDTQFTSSVLEAINSNGNMNPISTETFDSGKEQNFNSICQVTYLIYFLKSVSDFESN